MTPPPSAGPVLPPARKGPWALTHLTTSLTGDILGRRGADAGRERSRTGAAVAALAVALLVLAGLGLLGAWLLGL